MKSFYSDLTPFANFKEITYSKHYAPVPEDWWVVVADIKNSTSAIDRGEYKEVNLIGAAVIVCLANVFPDAEIPFAFGGDGATVLLSSAQIDIGTQELAKLSHLSQENFQLDLRVGKVQVAELIAKKAEVKVGKYMLKKGSFLAVFQGGGLSLADQLVKSDSRYSIEKTFEGFPNLTHLTCRWRPIPSQKGVVVSLIVLAARDPHDEVYSQCLQGIEKIFDGDLNQANPVWTGRMNYHAPSEFKAREAQTGISEKRAFRRLLETWIPYFLFTLKGYRWFAKTRGYMRGLSEHSDYRKFDDLLRMTLDCTEEQYQKLLAYLEEKRRAREIYFGTQCSDSSLMTCFVPQMTDGGHIHFIDGGSGGYAIAARQLKEQIKAGVLKN